MNFVHFTTDDGLIVEAKECVYPNYDGTADVSVCIYDPKKKDAIVWDTILAYNMDGMPFNLAVQSMFVPLSMAMVEKKIWTDEQRKAITSQVYEQLAKVPVAASS